MALRRRRKRRVWGWLPDKGEVAKIALLLGGLGAWWDARTKPDNRMEGAISLGVTANETIVALTERMGTVEARLARVEKRGKPSGEAQADSPRVQPQRQQEKGWRGFLSRWLGHRD